MAKKGSLPDRQNRGFDFKTSKVLGFKTSKVLETLEVFSFFQFQLIQFSRNKSQFI